MQNALFIGIGYSPSLKPELQAFNDAGELLKFSLIVKSPATITFDKSHRYCSGWRDILTGEKHACAEGSLTDKHEQCIVCMKKTGFNPAFYHSNTISPEQEERNKEPHTLYLAHFGASTLKVGITHEKRGIRRLLEQGARSALFLATFRSANIARQHEAKIAKIPGIKEAVLAQQKIELLSSNFDENRSASLLMATKETIEKELNTSYEGEPVFFDKYYFETPGAKSLDPQDVSQLACISGRVYAVIGTNLCTMYDDRLLVLPLKRLVGYRLTISSNIEPLSLPPVQASLL